MRSRDYGSGNTIIKKTKNDGKKPKTDFRCAPEVVSANEGHPFAK